ncbi:DNA polymerase lambda [Linum perenne]
MAPRSIKSKLSSVDPDGMFAGMVVFLIDSEVQPRRLEIWRQKLLQMGAMIEDRFSKRVNYVFATSPEALLKQVDRQRLERFKGRALLYQWIEESLRLGERVSEDSYCIDFRSEEGNEDEKKKKKVRCDLPDIVESFKADSKGGDSDGNVSHDSADSPRSLISSKSISSPNADVNELMSSCVLQLSLEYNPPDLNKNITEIFGKLINIYRALGEDRRSFSYYKAIPVIEKLPFKIESSEQVKGLPGIGKSLQDHIQEIVTTGKLSKLEHFETDEKLRAITLFGEVWGVGPATALKLYEKGHRTLDDLKNDDSLTNSQKIGLKYFDDIRTRIPRSEVQEMEQLLQKTGEEIVPGVLIVCGGSYRRGKSSCGDMDIVVTHPDGKSHKGFLSKFVKRLKDMEFLREDLIFSTHSEEGTDSGVDTYFGLCTYPGRELRRRVDFKVYPRDIYAFGLIAWTGNDTLNRRLRLLAESKGFRLDDTGLFPATHSSSGKRGSRATASLKLQTEKEVFEFLGFPWLEPHERNL